jgi:hypothetical protein
LYSQSNKPNVLEPNKPNVLEQDGDELYRRDFQSTYDELNSSQTQKAKSRGKNLEIMLKILFDSFGIPKNIAEGHVSKKYPDLDK